MKKILIILTVLIISLFCRCSYLDVIPDNITTQEMAFQTRATTWKYLSTCYSYMPMIYDMNSPGMQGADDIVSFQRISTSNWDFASVWDFARGGQNSYNPLFNYWSGNRNLFQGIHECNIFIANIDNVPDMTFAERSRWKAEVMTLKAYYIYWLFLHYGPIPLLKDNANIDSDFDNIAQHREKVDDVVNYIVELIDDACKLDPGLPGYITSTTTEQGRITRPGALAIKAKALVLAASPLFNGNEDYATFLDPRDGVPFFNQTKSTAKWEAAAQACIEAINEAETNSYKLHEFTDNTTFVLTEETKLQLTLRTLLAYRYNTEQILAPGNAHALAQRFAQPHVTSFQAQSRLYDRMSQINPTLNVIEEYYTADGIPIEEDKTTTIAEQYDLVQTPTNEPVFFAPDYTTIKLHLNKEPRFYANIGFDGGKWFDSEYKDFESAVSMNTKKGGVAGSSGNFSSATGYFNRKIISYRNENTAANNVVYVYPNLHIRLSDLYLMASEAINETLPGGPDERVFHYIQRIRHRAGLDKNSTLQETWRNFSNNPNKPSTQDGMREIIRRERLIELMFEGGRIHDIRRWKKADIYFTKQIRGLDIYQTTPDKFYVPYTVYSRTFSLKEYFWPIKQEDIEKNNKLVQNPLW